MRVYHFTEQPYPDAWDKDPVSIRATLPNKYVDPVKAADLYHDYLDAWQLCDELGLDIFVNEHHSTATCLTASANLILGILARTTKKARLLGLGFPIANNSNPLRVAEELAMIDVISRGRLEMGFVKGVPYEIHPANSLPVRHTDRFWEAHDVIMKALTTHDGPFSWEGEFFHYRNVNIWPRPYQQPTPPVWMTGLSVDTGKLAAERGHVVATLLYGSVAKPMFAAYRQRAQELGWTAGPDRLAYAAVIGVGNTRSEGLRRADLIAGYVRTAPIVLEPFVNPPGYNSVGANVAMLKAGPNAKPPTKDRNGNTVDFTKASIEQLIACDAAFAGTPDDVYAQIKDFNERVGGFGHLLFFGQGGFLDHADTKENLRLFAKEVLPRLRDLNPQAKRAATAAAE
jgi:alkanesulfonate monooxygenase SsuD/methylene tetrahydromethanopterin reductase-like flavin-dependent oxidoreductase (luciferase family)